MLQNCQAQSIQTLTFSIVLFVVEIVLASLTNHFFRKWPNCETYLKSIGVLIQPPVFKIDFGSTCYRIHLYNSNPSTDYSSCHCFQVSYRSTYYRNLPYLDCTHSIRRSSSSSRSSSCLRAHSCSQTLSFFDGPVNIQFAIEATVPQTAPNHAILPILP